MRRFLLWLFVLIPFAAAIIVGALVTVALLLWRACVEGYRVGRGLGGLINGHS